MKENMPGMGYAQGHVDLVDRGPRIANTFDNTYMKGRFPMWIRSMGEHPGVGDPDEPTQLKGKWNAKNLESDESGAFYEPKRPLAEEPYLVALHEFFADKIALWPGTPTQKEWLAVVMNDRRSTRDIADDEGVSQPAVVLGRQRAVEKFVAYMGGKEALAEKLRQYLHDKDAQDGGSRLHYLPRWVHG